METKVENQPTFVDTAKLLAAAGIVLVGFVAYYYFQSAQGRALWQFIQASRVELRKVVWPTREETIQTTIAVLIFAVIMGTFFWLLDILLLYVTSKVTGQGGL
jgi:preprotein translocase subunit SecE